MWTYICTNYIHIRMYVYTYNTVQYNIMYILEVQAYSRHLPYYTVLVFIKDHYNSQHSLVVQRQSLYIATLHSNMKPYVMHGYTTSNFHKDVKFVTYVRTHVVMYYVYVRMYYTSGCTYVRTYSRY